MVQESQRLLTVHAGLNRLIANIQRVLAKPVKSQFIVVDLHCLHFAEACRYDLRLTCIVEVECLPDLVTVPCQLLRSQTGAILSFRVETLCNWNVVIKVSLQSILPQLVSFLADHVVWADIPTSLGEVALLHTCYVGQH